MDKLEKYADNDVNPEKERVQKLKDFMSENQSNFKEMGFEDVEAVFEGDAIIIHFYVDGLSEMTKPPFEELSQELQLHGLNFVDTTQSFEVVNDGDRLYKLEVV